MNEGGGLYYPSRAFYAQDFITILQIKISFVISKDFVYSINQQICLIPVFNVGFENFYHRIMRLNAKRPTGSCPQGSVSGQTANGKSTIANSQ